MERQTTNSMDNMRSKIILCLIGLLLIVCNSIFAYDFQSGGIYYTIDGDNVSVTSGDAKYEGEVVIPTTVSYNGKEYSVTSIGSQAFLSCSGLTSINISNSVTAIGERAFSDCSGLKSITVASDNQVYDSRDNCNAIIETKSNTLITGCKNSIIPNSVTRIGSYAFYYCSGLTSITIPNSVTNIGSHAFPYCSSLTSITIPNSVTSIGSYAFAYCSGLTSITVASDNQVYDSRENCNALIETKSNTLITGCKNSVIPNSVISIESYAFSYCSGLTSISIPNSVTSIGKYAFERCSGLTSITIPNSVITIGSFAFERCSSLTSITIPNSVTSIGSYAFLNCGGLTSITVASDNQVYDSRENCNALIETKSNTLITGCKNSIIPNSVTSIGGHAFYHCSGLTSITIPNSVTSIGGSAFSYCQTLRFVKSKIRNPFKIEVGVFGVFTGLPTDAELAVPYGTKSRYEATEGWNAFSKITEDAPVQYDLNIVAVGNGNVKYDGKTLRNQSQNTTILEGSTITLSINPDKGYRLASVKMNDADVTSQVSNNQFTLTDITDNVNIEVNFEAITHTLTIKATGNGSAMFNETIIRGKSSSFTVNEGISAIVKFTPDAGYKIKSVKLNATDITSSVKDNQYTISDIKSDNNLEVEFEAITHTLTIKTTGNGSATYNNTVVKGESQSFTVNEGASATIAFTPDTGYRIKSVKLNATDITASVANNQYTINNIKGDNTLEVEFEAITHTLTIKATGNGSATFNSTVVKGKLQTFTVNEGASATVTFIPDANYKIKSIKLNTTDITSSVKDNQYTISNINSDNTLEVEFEAIIHTLNIVAIGNGNVDYNGVVIRNQSQSYSVQEGSSVVLSFAPDAGYRVGSVKVNNTDVTASVTNNSYTISNITANTTLEVTFEAIPPTTYAFTISAIGNGAVTYDENTVKGKTSSFTVVEGTNVVVKFTADEGYRLKSVKLNATDVTSSVVDNQYTISNIKANTSLEVTFEAIPIYALNIVATGNGSASYNGVTISNQSQNFTLREGASAVVSFSADNGYRIASVKVNNADVTSQIVDGKITINNITQNTNVEVVFEEIPPIVYALSITATGNGSVTYDGNTVKGKTSTFTIIEGSYITVQLSADDGYRLKSITLNGQDVTADVANNQYTTPKMMADAALVVVFEAIPTFALTIKSSAFGAVKFGDAVVANRTETFSVREGTSATMTFTPDDNGRLHSITLNGTDITKDVINEQYTISDIRADQSIEAEFVEDITKVTDAGIAYTVTSYDEQTVVVAAGNYGNVLTVPASFTAKEKTWTVVGIDEDALKDNTALAAIVWNPEVAFTAKVNNPNLLLYVKDAQYAPATIQNVVVNNQAENIVLVEAASGNDFYCPQTFTAKRISYEHNYSMISGYKTCQGWETLVLPFDVTMMINAKGQELTPYINWQYGNSLRPFWLYEMTTQGWKAGSGIKANTPYIISMPNNEMYDVSFNQTGNIQFIGTNVEVKASTEMKTGQHGNKRLVANYQTQEASADIYALNVSNEWSQNTAMEVEGSTFIRSLRSVHPFEAYLTVEGSNAPWAIPLFENMPTGINEKLIVNSEKFATATDWYTIDGRKLQGEPKQNGIYIIKGKKVRK